jgi:hypothetical protein
VPDGEIGKLVVIEGGRITSATMSANTFSCSIVTRKWPSDKASTSTRSRRHTERRHFSDAVFDLTKAK